MEGVKRGSVIEPKRTILKKFWGSMRMACVPFLVPSIINSKKVSKRKFDTCEDIKREILSVLAASNRFENIYTTVTNAMLRGQNTVVIENWSSYYRRFKPTYSDMWQRVIPADKMQDFLNFSQHQGTEITTKAYLVPKNEDDKLPCERVHLEINVTQNNASLFYHISEMDCESVGTLIYFGLNDFNLLRLFFQSAGFHTEYGTCAGKSGLLVSLN